MAGYIYIATDSDDPNMVRIGYTEDIKNRLKELNSIENVSECYALYEVSKRSADKKLHKIINVLDPMSRARAELLDKKEREFQSITKEQAYEVLKDIAIISDTEDRLHLTNKDGSFTENSQNGKEEPLTKPHKEQEEGNEKMSANEISMESREKYGLPKKKTIVYYDSNKKQFVEVMDIEAIEEYESWTELEITLEDGRRKNIHCKYLAEMQNSNFVNENK